MSAKSKLDNQTSRSTFRRRRSVKRIFYLAE